MAQKDRFLGITIPIFTQTHKENRGVSWNDNDNRIMAGERAG
jgi:hypothetical protein